MANHMEEHNAHSHTQEHEEHIGIPGYLGVFAILIVGTILTYFSSFWDLDSIFPGANTLLALLIAFTKMTFVVLYFMHVRWQSRLIWLTAVAGFFWMAIMFAYTMQDYLTRSQGLFTP
jgi:cytochrome c oxidase subunit IV